MTIDRLQILFYRSRETTTKKPKSIVITPSSEKSMSHNLLIRPPLCYSARQHDDSVISLAQCRSKLPATGHTPAVQGFAMDNKKIQISPRKVSAVNYFSSNFALNNERPKPEPRKFEIINTTSVLTSCTTAT